MVPYINTVHKISSKRIINTYECFGTTAQLLRPTKKAKLEHLSSITIGYLILKKDSESTEDFKRLKILLDSGCAATLINHSAVKTLKTSKEKTTNWSTKGGNFSTSGKCLANITLPALHENQVITWNCYVDTSDPKSCNYDLIIGRDLMIEVGIDLCFSTAEIKWDGSSTPMQSVDKLDKKLVNKFENELLFAHDPVTTDAERIQNIVENKYCPADLNTIVKNCKVLNNSEQSTLLQLLNKFKHLFDGTLGHWKTEPVNLELKQENMKPYHSKPYPVPYSQEKKLKDEVQRLVEYGVLRKVNRSEWGSPMFTIVKPDGSLRSLADLRELNT